MNYKKIHFFDMEMCCWNDGRKPSTGEIIEISFATLDVKTMSIIKQLQYYVRPELDTISPECQNLTGISQKKINNQGRHLSEVLKSINKLVGGKKSIFASWGRDDTYLFDECEKKGLNIPFIENINIATLYGLKHQCNNKNPSLDEALNKYGLKFEGKKHSAYYDAFNLAQLYKEMIKNE